MPFIHDDFLLSNDTAQALYHQYAKDLPIIDYHCHLPPQDVAADRRFADLFEIWLEGDHYKWRAMRSNGVDERFCTGDASPKEKFLAFAETVPHTLRNPLYHWCALEMKRYFGIDTLVSADSAEAIWEETNAALEGADFSAQGILDKFKVAAVGTTDEPVHTLEHHQAFAATDHATIMVPTFRPDKAIKTDDVPAWNSWVDTLEQTANQTCRNLAEFLDALKVRHDFFHEMGARLSDHGLERCLYAPCSDREADVIFKKLRGGQTIDDDEAEQFGFYVMRFVGELNAAKGWTMQLHVGAMRNNNTRLFRQLGPDTGFDSIGDYPQGKKMSRFLDSLDVNEHLPKTIIYNLNPRDNYLMGTMLGNFMDGSQAGKIQLGSGWWFLDQWEGMTMQMNALSQLGLFSRFVGMLTDSRSFMSYPRHEYFRRLLCNLLGQDAETGVVPKDIPLLGKLVEDISFYNARDFFGLPLKAPYNAPREA